MGAVKNAFFQGFGGTLGSFAAMALFGVLVMIGIALVYFARADPKTDKERNTPLLVTGVILIVLGSLPLAPVLGIQALGDVFSGQE